jgi:hypothetical protein
MAPRIVAALRPSQPSSSSGCRSFEVTRSRRWGEENQGVGRQRPEETPLHRAFCHHADDRWEVISMSKHPGGKIECGKFERWRCGVSEPTIGRVTGSDKISGAVSPLPWPPWAAFGGKNAALRAQIKYLEPFRYIRDRLWGQKCKQAGMAWSQRGGVNAMLRLRCAWASDRWDDVFAAEQGGEEKTSMIPARRPRRFHLIGIGPAVAAGIVHSKSGQLLRTSFWQGPLVGWSDPQAPRERLTSGKRGRLTATKYMNVHVRKSVGVAGGYRLKSVIEPNSPPTHRIRRPSCGETRPGDEH